jgi:hypothetical protein
MNKFNYLIYIDHGTIQSMLKFDSNKPGAHIWHVSAIQILASASEYDIPIGDDLLYNSNEENKNRKFITSFEANKEICAYLLKLCNNNKTPVQNAAIELISKILNYYAQLETSSSSNVDDNDEMSQFDSTKNPDNKAKQNKFYTVLYKSCMI